jgi:hypothetical protein
MGSLTCTICGGQNRIRIGSLTAICDSCGRESELDPVDAERYRQLLGRAEQLACKNTIDGYREAIRILEELRFVEEAQDKKILYEEKREELLEKQLRRKEYMKASDKKDTRIGVILLVLTILFFLAAAIGIAWLIILYVRDELTPATLTVIVIAIAVMAAAVIIGRIRS